MSCPHELLLLNAVLFAVFCVYALVHEEIIMSISSALLAVMCLVACMGGSLSHRICRTLIFLVGVIAFVTTGVQIAAFAYETRDKRLLDSSFQLVNLIFFCFVGSMDGLYLFFVQSSEHEEVFGQKLSGNAALQAKITRAQALQRLVDISDRHR